MILFVTGATPNDAKDMIAEFWRQNLTAEELAALIRRTEIPMVLVTNEVGSGIVPGEALSRRYRDLAGNVNKIIASAVDTLVLTVCGVPLKIKGEDDSVDL